MYYAHHENLPLALQRFLPTEAQDVYLREFNRIWDSYHADFAEESYIGPRQEVAHRYAWAKVKQYFFKSVTGAWQPKARKESYRDQIA